MSLISGSMPAKISRAKTLKSQAASPLPGPGSTNAPCLDGRGFPELILFKYLMKGLSSYDSINSPKSRQPNRLFILSPPKYHQKFPHPCPVYFRMSPLKL